ncbi:MAG TPA: M3 family oligoendopeptidase [Candidatus Ozemobacteraceae bacterium]
MSHSMTWDMSPFFPAFGGPEMTGFRDRLSGDIATLTERAAATGGLSRKTAPVWEELFCAHEDLYARYIHFLCYLDCLSATDAANEAIQAEVGRLALVDADLQKLDVELKRALKDVSDADFAAFAGRPKLAPIAYHLTRQREEARRAMSRELESLTADLGVDGFTSWGRLYNTISGKLTFELTHPDGRKELKSMAQRNALMEDPDPRIRRSAFEGGNAAWERYADVCAAALNHIAGTRLTLNARRGIPHFLDVALFQGRVSRATVDALMQAAASGRDLCSRFAKMKSARLGLPGLAWYDIEAPLPTAEEQKYTWDSGVEMLAQAFSRTFPEFGTFLREILEKRWVDAQPRPGRRPGAFCTGSPVIEEQRIFMTFEGGFGDLQTLAHEAGHAFHSQLMEKMRPFSRAYPMTLAETASTFAELILSDSLLNDPAVPDAQKASLLNIQLSNAIMFLLNIPLRYEFEKSFHEERQKGEVGVSRLKELMVTTQRRVFGDVLLEGGEDPLFWASKLHFYLTDITFYNFPYTFGFLLSRGMYALLRREGAAFLPKYREFLRQSGSDTAENVARSTLGVDLESVEFWTASVVSLEEDLRRFEALTRK